MLLIEHLILSSICNIKCGAHTIYKLIRADNHYLGEKTPDEGFLNKAKDLFICGTEKIWLDALPNITNGHC